MRFLLDTLFRKIRRQVFLFEKGLRGSAQQSQFAKPLLKPRRGFCLLILASENAKIVWRGGKVKSQYSFYRKGCKDSQREERGLF